MKLTKLAIPVVMLAASSAMLVATTAKAQTFKADFSTQLILAGGGTDPINTLTINSASRTNSTLLTFPNPAAITNYVLHSDGAGNLTWSNLSSNGVTSIIGTEPITAANSGGVVTVGLDLTNPNIWTGLQTFNGGLTETGNANINSPATGPDNNTDIDATGSQGVITIGNNGTGVGDSSTTYLAGAVDFTGTVTLPNGSVTAGSIGLTNQYMLVGNTSNDAAPLAPSANSVLITDATSPIGTPHWAQTLPSGLTYPAAQITGAGNIGGSTVISTTGTIAGAGLTSDVSTNTGATGAALTLANTGGAGGYDVTGTANSWYVTDAGAASFNGGVNTSDGNAPNISNTIGSSGTGSTTTINGAMTGINTSTTPNTIVNSTTNIDAETGTEGVINIGNNGGTTPGDSSTTNIAGTVDFTGQVNIPAGDLNLGLANDKFYIGNLSGVATPQTITQDVSINDTGLATVNGSHAPTFVVTGNESVADTFTASGPAIINNNLHVGGNVSSSSVLTGSEDILGTLLVGGGSTLHGVIDTGNVANVGNILNSGNLNNGGNVDLDTTTGAGGTNTVGNTTSTTNFLGSVNFPAGSVTASSLGLGNDSILIGGADNHAHVQGVSQDVSITNTGVATVNGSHAPTFVVTGNESVADSLTASGPTTINSNLRVTGFTSVNGLLAGVEGVTGTLTVGGGSTLHGVIDTGNVANVGNILNSGNLNNGGNVDLDTTTGAGGTNTVGNTTSTTNFLGSVNFPAGSVTASSLGLGNDSILIGGADNHAHVQGISQDVSITNTGVATVNGSHAPTFVVTGNESVADTFTASGPAIINNNLHVGGNVSSGSVLTGSEDILGTLLVGGGSTLHGVIDTGNVANVGNILNSGNLNNGGNVDLDTTTGAGGTNTVGNTTSTTNFLGSVNFPAGSVTASSLGLGNDSILIGGADNHAHAQAISQDVTITNAGIATVDSSHATTFAVVHAETVGSTLKVTGQTTLSSTALAPVSLAAPSGSVLALGSASSNYILTDGGSANTYTSISGANTTAGQVIVLVNASTTPADYITLTNGSGMPLNGAPVIIGDGGTATLMYDASISGWRLISAQ